jgi:hypothetical protein
MSATTVKTLEGVVRSTVDKLVKDDEKFSAYNVTTAVRDRVNANPAEYSDIGGGYDNNGKWQEVLVDHGDVRVCVIDLMNSGKLKRKSNGSYYIYKGVKSNKQVRQVRQVSSTPTIGSVVFKILTTGAADRMYEYIHRNAKQYGADVRHIQGAICRSGDPNRPMIKVAQLVELAQADDRFAVDMRDNLTHSVVELA